MQVATKLSHWQKILAIAWPLIVANSFWNIQLTIDRLFLGDYSTGALGAAVTVMGVFWTPMALLQQTAAYLMTFVAQFHGAKNFSMIGPAVWQAVYVSIVGGILFLLLIPAAQPIFLTFGHPPELLSLEVDYFTAICWSALPTALLAVASGYYTGLERTRIIILINAFGMVVNAIFDYLLISGRHGFPELGIAGAGYATVIANAVAALFGLWLIFFREHHPLYRLRSSWRMDLHLMGRFLRFGLPAGAQWALEGLAFTVFLIIIGRLPEGAAALSASSIAVTLMMLSVLPAMGVAQAVSVMLGHKLGEKKPEEAAAIVRSGVHLTFLYIAVVGATFVLFPNFYLGWFENKRDLELWSRVSSMATILLLFVAFFTFFDSLNLMFSFALKGAGDTRFVSLVALLLPWPLMVIPSWLLRDMQGAIYWAWAAASLFGVTQAVIFWQRFAGGKWKRMSVIDEPVV